VELTGMGERSPGPPSPRRGWQLTRRLWRLVMAVWIGSWLAITPALLLLRQVVVPGLASLPSGPGEVPAGDVALIVLEAVRGAERPLAFAVLSGLVLLWAWTVLWHAGVVAWTRRADSGRARLGELLRSGLAAWWRYARLSATALVALALAGAAIALPLWWGAGRAYAAMAERRLIGLLAVGAVGFTLSAIAVWLATLHGAWLLGLPGRRSAVVAWLRGLQATARRPVAGLSTWLVWVVPVLLASAVVPLLGGDFPGLRGGPLLVVLGLLASLARAVCWVGLFCSFAPVTGAVGIPEDQPEAGDGSAEQGPDEDGRGRAGEEPPAEPGVTVSTL
jgi:hypothetical protein